MAAIQNSSDQLLQGTPVRVLSAPLPSTITVDTTQLTGQVDLASQVKGLLPTTKLSGTIDLFSQTSGFLPNTRISGLGTMSTQDSGSVAITGGSVSNVSLAALTALGVRSSGAAFDLEIVSTEPLTANRNLVFVLHDATRTIDIAGNLTLAGALSTVGAFATVLTTTGATALILPVTGTLATLAGTEALTNKTYNGNTWTAGTGTLTIGAGKTLTWSNSLTISGTDGSSLAIGTGGTLGTAAYTAASAYLAVAGTAANSSQLLGATWAVPGAIGSTTPNSGAFTSLTATSFNGNTWAVGSGTLSIAGGKSLTSNNTLTLAGTDGSSLDIGAGGTLGSAAYISYVDRTSFTPTFDIQGTIGNLTIVYGTRTGYYVRVGNKVTVSINIVATTFTWTTTTGNVIISGLPFVAAIDSFASVAKISGWLSTGYSSLSVQLVGTTSNCYLQKFGSNNGQTAVPIADFPTTGAMAIGLTFEYFV